MNQKPKILFTNFHPLNGGGHATYIEDIITSRLSNRYEFAVACPPQSEIYAKAKKAEVLAFACDFPGNILEIPSMVYAIFKLRRIHREYPFDILHCNGARDQTIAGWSKALFSLPITICRTRHAIRPIPKHRYHEWLYNRVPRVNIYVSHTALNICEAPGYLRINRHRVIPNGVDLEHYDRRLPDVALARRMGITQDEFVFGTVAGLSSYKRVDLLLKAASQLRTDRPFKIVLLGFEPDSIPLLKRARQLYLDNVIYAGYHEDDRRHISIFDVGFVLSDSIETISFAARKMMAMGIPLIVSDYSGLIENVTDRWDGRITEVGNVESIRAAMDFYLHLDERSLQRYRERAREKAELSFSQETQFEKLDEAYAEMLGNHGISIALPADSTASSRSRHHPQAVA